MKLIEGNKSNPNAIELMEWSNKMDLIALASDTGKRNHQADKVFQCTFIQKGFPILR